MASAYADQAIHLRDSVALTEQDLATATGASQATVAAWLDDIAAPEGAHADRLIELAVIVQRLARTMTADAIPGWLNTAVPVLDGQRALGAHRRRPVPARRASGRQFRISGV